MDFGVQLVVLHEMKVSEFNGHIGVLQLAQIKLLTSQWLCANADAGLTMSFAARRSRPITRMHSGIVL